MEAMETRLDSVESLRPVAANQLVLGNTKSLREGAHYTLKIESFSLFLNTKTENYESRAFEIGGYKWKLSLYPNGNKKRDVNDHISLYLAIADTETLPRGWEVNVNFKLFVFDHLHDKYLTVQDDEGGIRRFHRMKAEWGMDKFLPLDTFNDASNGYLVDDCCVFGAEVSVLKSNGKGECVSTVKDPLNNIFTWKIDKLSATAISKEVIESEEFVVENQKWKLRFYPKGTWTVKGKSVSLYLGLSDSKTLPPELKVYAEYELRMRDQIFGRDLEKQGAKWFGAATSTRWGFQTFMALSDFKNASKGFVVNDTVIVEAEITLISTLKDL